MVWTKPETEKLGTITQECGKIGVWEIGGGKRRHKDEAGKEKTTRRVECEGTQRPA